MAAAALINWADLTGELLNLILSKLFARDRHSFSLVCKPWSAVAANSPYRYSPCLVSYYRRAHTWKFYQYNNFINMSFPDLKNARIHCSKYGWLLMSVNEVRLFFFDPSNNVKFCLPGEPPILYPSLCFFNPPTSNECVVVGITHVFGGIEICTLKRGVDKWRNIIDYHFSNFDLAYGTFKMSYGAPVLHCGLIYLLSIKGDVAILDIKKKRLDFKYKCLSLEIGSDMEIKEHHLVKVKGEYSLFGVFVFKNERKVRVFRLSSDMKWDLVEDIGDRVLYLSHISSFGDKARTKSIENGICFPMFHGDVAVFYSLRDNKYHSIDGDYLEGNAYGLKKLEHAGWIIPLPAHELEHVAWVKSSSWLSEATSVCIFPLLTGFLAAFLATYDYNHFVKTK